MSSIQPNQNQDMMSRITSFGKSFGENMKRKVDSWFNNNNNNNNNQISTSSYPNDGPLTGGKKKNPKKGQASKTRKGRLDFVTHKGDKYFNRKNKRQTKSVKGEKGTPYLLNGFM